MRLTFIDLETTSTDSNLTNIIQLWVKRVIDGITEKEIDEYFSNNGQYITLGSRNITSITEKKLEGKKIFEESPEVEYLSKNSVDSIYVAHNGKSFDFKILSRYGINFRYSIDTLLVAQIVLDDKYDELEQSFKLWHIRYWMEDRNIITLPETLNAHNAYDDIIILEQVFNGLIKIYKEKNPTKTEQELLFDFINMTHKQQLLKRMVFGKHKGIPFSEIPKSYLTWCLANMTELDDNMKFTMNYYLNPPIISQWIPVSISNNTSQVELPPEVNIPEMPAINFNSETTTWDIVVDPSTFSFNSN